ncbi:MAG: hypothetical protein WBC74_04560 [Candidatus Omnitrophota bacterium]
MNKTVKHIIAREGLIIILSYALGFGFAMYAVAIQKATLTDFEFFVAYSLIVYVPIQIIRFIVWAVRTLKEK